MILDAPKTQPESSPYIKQQVTQRRLDMLLQQTEMTGFFSVLFAAILSFMMRNGVYAEEMQYWLAINLCIVILRETLIYPKVRAKRKLGKITPNQVYLINASFWLISGLLWGWGGYYYLPSGAEPELMVTFIAVMVGITFGNTISFSPSVWIGISFIVPTISGFALRVYQFDYLVLFYCILFYSLFLLITIIRVSRVVIHTISLDLTNQQLLHEVTEEKKRAEAEKIKAQRANQSKTEFMTSASHDLRQPLNSLGLFLFALKQKIESGAGISDSLQLLGKVEQAHQSVSDMFSRMLEVSNVENGKITPRPAQVETSNIIASVIDEYSQQSQSQNKKIQINYHSVNASICTDELLFTRIVRNLVDNAVKYTHKGKISIAETLDESGYRLEVRDTGIGIPSAELNKIFEEYHQVANKKRDARQGLGLGLFITFRLCQLLGFKIDVESTEGLGSCFSISMAVTESPKSEPTIPDISALAPFTDLSVLVVDDDPQIISAMRLILQQWQCSVRAASDLQTTLEAVSRSAPDIILFDYRLEDELTGWDVLKNLESRFNRTFPVIFITGEHWIDVQKQDHTQLDNDLSNYRVLQKPVIATELHQAIKQTINQTFSTLST